jgi:ABC-type uncharacterized transport system substrate-binding protein
MRLIGLAVVVTLSLVLGPLAAESQQAAKIARIGYLEVDRAGSVLNEALRQGLRDLGYVEGRNVVIEYRDAEGKLDRLPALAAELVALKVDVLLVGGTAQALAAKQATRTLPIVFVTFGDPVRTGLVASLARPGRNMTGVTMISGELAGKRLELLREILPKVRRVAVLWNPVNRDTEEQLNETRGAARSLGMQVEAYTARAPHELEGAFAAMARDRADAVFPLSDAMFGRQRRQIADLAARNRLAGMYHWRNYVEAGGLMSYGPNLTDLFRRSATYVDKILKGAKPADLPVEQPTKFELVINLKTAKALGLTIPQTLLLRADQVIQ